MDLEGLARPAKSPPSRFEPRVHLAAAVGNIRVDLEPSQAMGQRLGCVHSRSSSNLSRIIYASPSSWVWPGDRVPPVTHVCAYALHVLVLPTGTLGPVIYPSPS